MHIQKMITKIIELIDSGRNDSIVITFLVLESYFRPFGWRILEYIYWTLTGNLDISLGIAQLKAKNNILFNNNNFLSRLKNIKKLESFKYNYDIINLYLKKAIRYSMDEKQICKYYNGECVGIFYVTYFMYAKNQVDNIKYKKLFNNKTVI